MKQFEKTEKTKESSEAKAAETEMSLLAGILSGREVKIQSGAVSLLGEESCFKPVKPGSAPTPLPQSSEMSFPSPSFARPPTPAIQIPSPKSVHSPVDRSHAVESTVEEIKRIINEAFLGQSKPEDLVSPYVILDVARLLSEAVLSHPNLKNYRSEKTRLSTEDGAISPWPGYREAHKPLLISLGKEKTAFIEEVLKVAEEDYQADLKGRSSIRFR